MAELRPIPLGDLLRRATNEWRQRGAIFDLERAAMWQGSALDLSVQFHGHRAATPVGPAAGPHSQLAQNIALAWLGGARIVELKTIQINDQLVIPRPCIDVQNIGFNVEWSQELRLEQSALEYAKAWLLVHALQHWNPLGLQPRELDAIFDMSVGYSLAGVREPRVARWVDGLRDARGLLEQARREVPPELRAWVDIDVPTCISDSITLSTFHGCPADEIELIAEHLLRQHGVHVVLKLNPTLLGYDQVDHLLHDVLGYSELRLRREDFEHDLQWPQALQLIQRLRGVARQVGKTLGVKVSNTLVVENHKTFFPATEKVMYLSGQPLHVLTTQLGARVQAATNGEIPLSFSAGVDAVNFADTVACGFVPITVCTDLLRPGGYGRLPKYLTRLQSEMVAVQADNIGAFVRNRAAQHGGVDAGANLARYAQQVVADPRYGAKKNSAVPRRLDKQLQWLDCVDCGKCVPVCPNDANFALHVEPRSLSGETLRVGPDGTVVIEPGPAHTLSVARQFANFADACNECGNCDIFCPEVGGPYRIKPRFFGSAESWLAEPLQDGLWVQTPTSAAGRVQGRVLYLRREGEDLVASDGHIEARLAPQDGRVRAAVALQGAPVGHQMSVWQAATLGILQEKALLSATTVAAMTR